MFDLRDFVRFIQWGRDRVIAEIGGTEASLNWVGLLQWGRDRVIAEIQTGGQRSREKARFNGAAIA